MERILEEMNEALAPLELEHVLGHERPRFPVVLVGGLPRSGTTLLVQLLVAAYRFGHVDNLMARFWRAPYLGAVLSREILSKYGGRGSSFRSLFGTTLELEGVHEFGYFWRHWFPYDRGEAHELSEADLAAVDGKGLAREVAALESVFEAPLVFKNPILFALNIGAVARVLPEAVFVVCEREPLYVAQSTLETREAMHGSRERWIGPKPREYVWLKKLSPIEQVAGQVQFTRRRIEEALAGLDRGRYVRVRYEDLCRDPQGALDAIAAWVAGRGGKVARKGWRAEPLEDRNGQRVGDRDFEALARTLQRFSEMR